MSWNSSRDKVTKNLNSLIGRLHFRRPSVALYSGQFTHTSYNDSIEVHLQTEITVPELLFEADESALFDLFVATSMASSTAVMEELLVSVGFNCGNRVKNTGELLGLNSVQNWKKRAFYRYLVNFQTLSFINVLRNLVVYRKANTKICL